MIRTMPLDITIEKPYNYALFGAIACGVALITAFISFIATWLVVVFAICFVLHTLSQIIYYIHSTLLSQFIYTKKETHNDIKK